MGNTMGTNVVGHSVNQCVRLSWILASAVRAWLHCFHDWNYIRRNMGLGKGRMNTISLDSTTWLQPPAKPEEKGKE
jgi:hypothetical protein